MEGLGHWTTRFSSFLNSVVSFRKALCFSPASAFHLTSLSFGDMHSFQSLSAIKEKKSHLDLSERLVQFKSKTVI